MTETKKGGEQKEVQFTTNVSVNGKPYIAGQVLKMSASEAANVIGGGYAVEMTDELRAAEDNRKALPQNQPLKESDLVVAEHDSGETVVYKDPREKGPLDPKSVDKIHGVNQMGGSEDAKAGAKSSKKGAGQRVEALPKGDIPTGIPVGAMQAAQEVKAKPNVEPAENLDTKAAEDAAKDKGTKSK